jgi:hypothetical protein
MTKTCTECGEDKPLSDYYMHKLNGRVYPYSECKLCTGKRVKKYKETHPVDKAKAKATHDIYYANNRDVILNKCKTNYPKKKDKVAIHNKEYYQSHRDDILETRKQYRKKNRVLITARAKVNYHNNPEKNRKKYMRNKVKIAKYSSDRRIKIKTEVLTYYGNGKCACVKCGFDDIRALSIDHINGNGSEHRKENRYVRGNHVYEWLKQNKFPDGYQTLCMNCNFIKRIENNECNSNKSAQDNSER